MSDEIPTLPTDPVSPPYPTPTVRPVQKKQGRGGTLLLGLAAVVAVAGVAFAAGRFTAPAAAASNGTGRTGLPFGSFNPGGGGFPGAGRGGQLGTLGRSLTVRGQVTAASAISITVKLDNGSEVTLPLDSQTTYHTAVAGSATDVTVGSTVVVEPGTANIAPGASFNPTGSFNPGGFGAVNFGPAVDITVVQP